MGQLFSGKTPSPTCDIYEFIVPIDNYNSILTHYQKILATTSDDTQIISTYSQLKLAHAKLSVEEKKTIKLPPLRLW